MDIRFSDIKTKDIISVSDGKFIGRAVDIIFDNVSNSVKGFSVPVIKNGFSLKKPEYMFVSIKDIFKIGSDVILVDNKQIQKTNSNMVPKIFKKVPKLKQAQYK